MKVEVRVVGGHLASVAWVALKAFAGTLLAVTLAGVVLASLSNYVLREQDWIYRLLAVMAAVIESVTIGVVLGFKWALAMAVAHALGSMRLGRTFVRSVFDPMLKVTEDEEMGERGGRITRSLERLPLSRADELLTEAVRKATGDAERGGWLRRLFQMRSLEAIRKYTLARFREDGAKHGGVNVLKVKEEVAETVDEVLIRKVRGGLRLWTTLVIIGLPLVVAAQTWVLLMLVRAKG